MNVMYSFSKEKGRENIYSRVHFGYGCYVRTDTLWRQRRILLNSVCI